MLLFGSRIVVPKGLQTETLKKIHCGHLGVGRCHQRVSAAVWWPNVSTEVEKYIQHCPECLKMTPSAVQPLIQTPLPSCPWEIGADLFQLDKGVYLVVADYFSRFVEVLKLTSTTSTAIVKCFKAVHGIPTVLMTDNGPQFDSIEMKSFAESYKFTHRTSSPRYPQGSLVRTVKRLMKYEDDPYLALLNYRAKPLPWCGLSSSQLLMGRRIKTLVPQVKHSFMPNGKILERVITNINKNRNDTTTDGTEFVTGSIYRGFTCLG